MIFTVAAMGMPVCVISYARAIRELTAIKGSQMPLPPLFRPPERINVILIQRRGLLRDYNSS